MLGGHAAFQAIMHVLSELRNPLFEAPDRERALRALQLSRLLKEHNHTKAWQAVKSMIDKVVGERIIDSGDPSESSSSYTSPPPQMPTSVPMTDANNVDLPTTYMNQIPSYAIATSSEPLVEQPVHPQPHVVPALQPLQADQTQFNWDDLNFTNIVGDGQNNNEMPEFDFVSCLRVVFEM